MNIATLTTLAEQNGLVLRGGFLATSADKVPVQASGEPSSSLLLFGQTGSSLWPRFSQSSEYADGRPHPLDRWSERKGKVLANKLDGKLLLPFGDPPHHPFISWAMRAEDVQASRLGMLIHPVHGLWHAYRFAIALAETVSGLPRVQTSEGICDNCSGKPCLTACPVNAFDGTDYDVQSCSEYFNTNPGCTCLTSGCLARDACPEGQQSRYVEEQRRFHMQQFLHAMNQKNSTNKNT